MRTYVARIERTEAVSAIFDYLWRFVRRRGAVTFSYHLTPIFRSQTSRDTVVFAKGYSRKEQEAYLKGGYRDIDPIPRLTLEFGPVLTWAEATSLGAGDPGAEAYFEEMRRRGHVHGFSMALFGPRNRSAYASLGFAVPLEQIGDGARSLFHGLLQVAHMRICKILDEGEQPVSLSEREREVLVWMARGKSGADIAAILAISPETVRTYTKRIYEKLDVGDRVAATVKALKLGLIEA